MANAIRTTAPPPARAPRDGLRGVLFDLDGTMYVQSVLRGLMAAELAVGLASRRLRRQDIGRLAKFRREREALKHQSSEGVVLERWQYEVHGEGADSLETLVQEWMHRRPLKYLRACRRRGLVELLTMLSARGYRLGVLSDFPVADKLGALGVDRWFSLMLCTTDPEINALKPSARGFLHACRLWGLAPHEVLYVGDRIDVDAQGAAAAGLDCWIVGPRKGHLDPSTPQHHVGTFSQLKHALSGR